MDQPTSREANREQKYKGKSAEERSGRTHVKLCLSASRHRGYFTATIVSVSPFVTGVQNSREITHEKNLVGSEADAEGMGILEDFLKRLPEGPRYAVEVRHRSWLGSDLPEMLRERDAALTLIDYPRMPRMEEAKADFSYIRWLGNCREFPEGHTHLKKERDDDLLWWSDLVDCFLQEGRTVFAYANNHYQNHSPSTLERFLEIRRGER